MRWNGDISFRYNSDIGIRFLDPDFLTRNDNSAMWRHLLIIELDNLNVRHILLPVSWFTDLKVCNVLGLRTCCWYVYTWPCDPDVWPFDHGQWSYMAGYVVNSSTKFEDNKPIRSWVMSSDISHRIPLTMRLQPLCMRCITWPMSGWGISHICERNLWLRFAYLLYRFVALWWGLMAVYGTACPMLIC